MKDFIIERKKNKELKDQADARELLSQQDDELKSILDYEKREQEALDFCKMHAVHR